MRARAELALAGGDPTSRPHALRAVVAQAERLDAAISALLAVARQEIDPGPGRVGPGGDRPRVRRAWTSSPPAGLPRVEGEEEVVRRALAPLIENARRHAADRVCGSSCRREERACAPPCATTGPASIPALGESVFEPGVRGDRGGGAGLGLPLARRLARSCGGDVVTGDGPGGCFVLELPALGRPALDAQTIDA